jgi:hypothetical protein
MSEPYVEVDKFVDIGVKDVVSAAKSTDDQPLTPLPPPTPAVSLSTSPPPPTPTPPPYYLGLISSSMDNRVSLLPFHPSPLVIVTPFKITKDKNGIEVGIDKERSDDLILHSTITNNLPLVASLVAGIRGEGQDRGVI